MIPYLYIIVIVLAVNSCAGQKSSSKTNDKNFVEKVKSNFVVTKIDSTASYYFVYVLKDESTYKIISRKQDAKAELKKIQLENTYFFELSDIKTDNGNPLTGFSSTDPCFLLEDKTEVCREKGIFGPYRTENLKGIFYKK